MTDLIEKMARAIFGTQGICHTDDERMFEPVKWEDLDADDYQCMRDGFRQSARAALSATGLTANQIEGIASGEMVVVPKVPTEAMKYVGGLAFEDAFYGDGKLVFNGAEDAYRVMIAAAKEAP